MGRIKTLKIKRVTNKLMELHRDKFTDSFEKNREILNRLIIAESKKLKNIIAGYITRLKKKSPDNLIL
ncbi:MAG: 30S ribosomal protein S17e [Nanoarchaeota archaeon]|nr:30S ribosomal protein S17e [Nanoarchaeota archaeon]